MTHRFTINGIVRGLDVPDHQTLAEMLREPLRLTGCKVGCDQAACGACTVLVEGIPVAACATFAVTVAGQSIETIEGLAPNGVLDPVQRAFAEHGAAQCGFCTAGIIMTTHALLRRDPNPDEQTIRHWLEAHICRCTGYVAIIRAIQAAARALRHEAAS